MSITHSYIPLVPLTVPDSFKTVFIKNYQLITHSTDRLFMISSENLSENINTPNIKVDNIFNIGDKNYIGTIASHLGLISRYGSKYRNITYTIKLNSKFNTVNLWSIPQIINFKSISNLNICAIEQDIYLDLENKYDNTLEQAANAIYQAHSNGLVTLLSINTKKSDFKCLIKATRIANVLGADFVKLKAPSKSKNQTSAELLKTISQASGNTKVICLIEDKIENKNIEKFLVDLSDQLNIGGISGCAIDYNSFKIPINEAIALTKAINLLVYEREDLKTVINSYKYAINN